VAQSSMLQHCCIQSLGRVGYAIYIKPGFAVCTYVLRLRTMLFLPSACHRLRMTKLLLRKSVSSTVLALSSLMRVEIFQMIVLK